VSQRISEFLRDVSEDERQRFLSMWLEHVLEGDYVCYDITSVSHPTQDTMNILIIRPLHNFPELVVDHQAMWHNENKKEENMYKQFMMKNLFRL